MKQMLLWLLLTGGLTGCHRDLAQNEYFCPPSVVYTKEGTIDANKYAVDRACYKSMTLKQKACYTEVRP